MITSRCSNAAPAPIAVQFMGFSAIWQGIICASGIALLPKTKGQIFTNTFLLALYDELPGTLGIVWAIVALSLLKLM